VAVGAEQHEVLQPVVAPIAVHVVEGHRQGASTPLPDAAVFAPIGLQALCEKTPLELSARSGSGPREEVLGGYRSGAGCHVATGDGIGPGRHAEPEVPHALHDGMPLVVVGSDRLPVVASGEPRVWRVPEASCVVADGALGQPEGPSNLGQGQALFEQVAYALSRHATELDEWIGSTDAERMFRPSTGS
jgi:hypothetical protein